MSAALGKPRVSITYCTQCRFLPRAAWMAQELLTTFADELGEVALVPGDGGVFQVRVAASGASPRAASGTRAESEELELVACRVRDGGFPELAELKRRIRDRVAPGRELGHSERA
jgi:selenoprotein W-related protein